MPSTYSSSLKIQLMATGENATTWGNVTNANLGTVLEEAITGTADVAFSSADVDLAVTDSTTSQAARNLRLNLTGTSGGARNLYLATTVNATHNAEKVYIINNGLADTVTVRNKISGSPSGSNVAIPAGKTAWVFNTGTNVVSAVDFIPALTATNLTATNLTATNISFTAPLAAASGGTGTNATPTAGNILIGTGTGYNSVAVTAGAGINVVANATTFNISATVSAYPGAGIAVSTGSAWDTSKTAPSGTIVGTTDTQTLSNKTLSGANTNSTILDNGAASHLIGYRQIPQNAQNSNYTLVLADDGKHIYSANTGAQSVIIPTNANVAFPTGTAVVIVNNGTTAITVNAAAVTLYQAGTSNTGNRTLSTRGMATLLKVGTDTWFISGAGVS